MAERDASQCYIKVSVLMGLGQGMHGSEREEKSWARDGGASYSTHAPGLGRVQPQGLGRVQPWSPASSQAAANSVAFRWCACGSLRSWCWAYTSWAPTQAKLLKDLLWGSSKSRGMSAVT